MLKEFKAFAMRGNVIDMAVGIIVGAAFGSIVNSLVADIVSPPIGMFLGEVDFTDLFLILREGDPIGPYASIMDAQLAGAVTLNYGLFINTVVSFLIVTFVVFLLIRAVNRLQDEAETPSEAPSTKECPFCRSEIHLLASRCPLCTSELSTESE
jgi:large conductance mechanosensitive channel